MRRRDETEPVGIGGTAALKILADTASRGSLLAVAALLVRVQGPEGLGAFAQTQTVATLFVPLATLGLAHAVVPFLAARPWDAVARRHAYRVLRWGSAGAAISGVVVAAMAPWINRAFLGVEDGTALFRATGAVVLALGIETLVLELLKSRQRFGPYVALQACQAAGVLLSALWAFGTQRDLTAFLVVNAALRFTIALGGVRALGPPEAGTEAEDQPLSLRAAVRFGLPVSLSGLGAWTVALADRLVLGRHYGAETLGRYAAVYTASGIIAMVGAAIFLPAYPRLVRARQAGGATALTAELRALHGILGPAVIATTGFLMLVTGRTLDALAGRPLGTRIATIVVVLTAIGMDQWNGLTHFTLLAGRRTAAVQRAWAAGSVVGVAGTLALVPAHAAPGAAVATLLAYAAVNALLLRSAARMVPIRGIYAWHASGAALAVACAAAALAAFGAATADTATEWVARATLLYWTIWAICGLGGRSLRRRRTGPDHTPV